MTEPPRLIAALLCHRTEQPDGNSSSLLDIFGATDRIDLINPKWPVALDLTLLLVVRDVDYSQPRHIVAVWFPPNGPPAKVIDIRGEAGPQRTAPHFDDWWTFRSFLPPLTEDGDYGLAVTLDQAPLVTLLLRITSPLPQPWA